MNEHRDSRASGGRRRTAVPRTAPASSATVAATARTPAYEPAYELVHPALQRWCWEQGWKQLRWIQELAIPPLLQTSDDALVAAETAGGKTEAAMLPLLTRVLFESRRGAGFRLVYISPLRALINDQAQRLGVMCSYANLSVHPWHGEVSESDKRETRRNPGGVLLITPESLEAFCAHRYAGLYRLFARCTAFVIDEFHALADNERGMQTLSLMTRVDEAVGRRIRRVALSATIGDLAGAARRLNPDHPESVHIVRAPTAPLRASGPDATLETTFRTAVERAGKAPRGTCGGQEYRGRSVPGAPGQQGAGLRRLARPGGGLRRAAWRAERERRGRRTGSGRTTAVSTASTASRSRHGS